MLHNFLCSGVLYHGSRKNLSLQLLFIFIVDLESYRVTLCLPFIYASERNFEHVALKVLFFVARCLHIAVGGLTAIHLSPRVAPSCCRIPLPLLIAVFSDFSISSNVLLLLFFIPFTA